MPFKSESQRRKFAEKVKRGEIPQETFDEWNKDTPKNLPEKVERKKEPGKRAPTHSKAWTAKVIK